MDADLALNSMLTAALEVHQRQVEEHNAKVIAALEAMEGRLLHTLRGDLEDSVCVEERQVEFASAFSPGLSAADPSDLGRPPPVKFAVRLPEEDKDIQLHGHKYQLPSSLHDCLSRVVRSPMFDVSVSLIILMSAVLTFTELQCDGYQADVSLGLDSPGKWQGADDVFRIFEYVFVCCFVSELCLRLYVLRLAYLKDRWSWFDVVLITISVLDTFVLGKDDSAQNIAVLRLVRISRLTRSLRALRELHLLRPLQILIKTIAASMHALMWSMLFLLVVQILGAVVICKTLHYYIVDESNSMEDRLWANRIFGSGTKSVYTFFEITFSGGWPSHVRPLVEKVGYGYGLFFMLYIGMWVFAVMKIIGALFIKETFAQAEKDEKTRIVAMNSARQALTKRIRSFLKQADVSNDGEIDVDEFARLFDDPNVKDWFALNGIDVFDPKVVWRTLAVGSGTVDINDFVDSILRMQGPAKSRDMMVVLQDCREVAEQCRSMSSRLDSLEALTISMQQRFGSKHVCAPHGERVLRS